MHRISSRVCGCARALCVALLASACSSQGEPDAGSEMMWRESVCEGELVLLEDLNPANPPDYIVAAQVEEYRGTPMDTPPHWVTMAKHGEKCEHATDAAGCRGAVAALLAPPPSTMPPALVVTRGDDVFRITTREELHDLLGPIDTYDEAVLAMFLAGQAVACPSESRFGGAIATSMLIRKESDSRYEVVTEWITCGYNYTQRSQVTTEGDADIGTRELLSTNGCAH